MKQFTWQLFSATGKVLIIWVFIYLSIPLLILTSGIAVIVDFILVALAGQTIKTFLQFSTPHIKQSFLPVTCKRIVLLVFILGLVFLPPIISFPVSRSLYKWIYWHPLHGTGNYTQLTQALKLQNWQLANKETLSLMLEITQRKHTDWLSTRSIETFPCDALHKIDTLWTDASDGKFGFSVQTRIWKQLNKDKISFSYEVPDIQEKFYKYVGWTDFGESKTDTAMLKFADIPVGHFPTAIGSDLVKACVTNMDKLWFGQAMGCYQKIFIRTEECNSEKLN